MAAGLSLQPWQWWTIAIVYVVAFVVPAVWMARKAKRDGDAVFVWTLLVLVGSVLGIIEYYEHRSILKRRAKRAEKAKSAEAPSTPHDEGGADDGRAPR